MHVQDPFHIGKLLFAGLLSGFVLAATPSQAQSDPPPGAAMLMHLEGNVTIQPSGIDDWGQAYRNMPANPGDRIYADPSGRGALHVAEVRTYFDHNTDLTLVNNDSNGVVIGLAQGSAEFVNDGFPPGVTLVVQTPNGAVSVDRHAAFRVDVDRDDGYSIVTVLRYNGFVDIHGGGDFYTRLSPDQSIQIAGTNPVYAQPLESAPVDDFEHWAGVIDTHRFHSVSLQYVSAEVPGYDLLDETGDWQPQSQYGPIWFPRVEAGWAPYRHGHWVNRPFYGWTWVADEPWGVAPFHYGRWVVINGRWGWIPGPREGHPIWSPAQVVFAGGVQVGGASLSVWIPLGPGEPYRPWYPCSPAYINQINIVNIRPAPAVHVETDYVRIVNVTNVTNITYVNKTVGVTAMRQDDFAAGRPARTAAVNVNVTIIQNIHPAAPAARPPAQPIIIHPVARPAAVAVARPVLINSKGQQAVAAPNARPVPIPVKAAPPVVKPVPGRTVVGAATLGGKPAPPARPVVAAQPVKPAANQPEAVKPTQPTHNPAQPKPAVQQPKPAVNTVPPKPGEPVTKTEAHPGTPNQQKPANQGKPKQGKNEKDKKPEDQKPEDKQ